MMALSSADQDRVESFRIYVEDSIATDDRYGPAVREDTELSLATRFFEGTSCWFEFALRLAAKQVRVGFFTTDPAINSDCEQVIAESGETIARFVGQAFEESGLDWSSPAVEHGKERDASFYATSLTFDDMIDLDSDGLRDKALRMLEGYLIAFGPALGAEEED